MGSTTEDQMGKWPMLIIGVLIGIIIMQWSMKAARGQEEEGRIIVAQSFGLIDSEGNVVGSLSAS